MQCYVLFDTKGSIICVRNQQSRNNQNCFCAEDGYVQLTDKYLRQSHAEES